MDEANNQDICDKIENNFNKVFEETYKIRSEMVWVKDKLEPTYENVRNIHAMVDSLSHDIKKLQQKISFLEDQIKRLST